MTSPLPGRSYVLYGNGGSKEVAMSDVGKTLAEEVESLQQTRDELRVQMHLARAELKQQWDRLESKWHEMEDKSGQIARTSNESMRKVATATRHLVDEIREGYRELKSVL
jgi:archaellum component FlaC